MAEPFNKLVRKMDDNIQNLRERFPYLDPDPDFIQIKQTIKEIKKESAIEVQLKQIVTSIEILNSNLEIMNRNLGDIIEVLVQR